MLLWKSHLFFTIALVLSFSAIASAQRLETPRRHDRPPGPPLSPEEAVAKMTVPEGFSVEVVAAEPDVVNPVAMCIDEKGRFWITESLEYPRKSPGPGRDRVKVLEDTDGDGKVDKTTIFADGLNIPSGIAVGYGGVWVANSPDLLFMQDTDGDLKADKIETVVTGFGRTDTHELPNSLTWGPDGWLYGLNGVFNYCDVKYAETNPNFDVEHPGWKFTCAMFRIHPRTRKFEIFAEGTSNPWGIAINEDGEFFISACVIDHLWHIVETGYYTRQGGPYPPHTWPMGSIVEHKHQKAAYCGITWFDSDAYPEEYRGVLYMGNIHGGCINADIAERHGSTYKAKPHPGFPPKPGAWDNDEYDLIRKTGDKDDPKLADFLTANDAWFMPVVQKVGPDGCLYILDWYDRYHCYQDANADPDGVERVKGRLYRVRYKDTPHTQPFDLATKSDDELIALLGDPNVFIRSTARRVLAERLSSTVSRKARSTVTRLEKVLSDTTESQLRRLQALWTLASAEKLDRILCLGLLQDESNEIRRWCVKFCCELVPNQSESEALVLAIGFPSKRHPAPVLLQMASSYPKMIERIGRRGDPKREFDLDPMFLALLVVARAGEGDPAIQQVAWRNLSQFIGFSPMDFNQSVERVRDRGGLSGLEGILPRAITPIADATARLHREDWIGGYFEAVVGDSNLDPSISAECLNQIITRILDGQVNEEAMFNLRSRLNKLIPDVAESEDEQLAFAAASIGAIWGDDAMRARVRDEMSDSDAPQDRRMTAIRILIHLNDSSAFLFAEQVLENPDLPLNFRGDVINAIASHEGAKVAEILMRVFEKLDQEMKPKALEVLTQRASWSAALLKAIEAKQVDKDALNLNQIARVASFKDEVVKALVAKVYGQVRTGRGADRQKIVNRQRDFLHGTPGDPERGALAFKKVCAQCHKIYGEGAEVGPDITRNGRNNWQQLLTNVFDPSAVIGPGYQARILVTDEGRVLTGLAVEESDQRVVLKIQGGKIETIPRDQIEEYKVSEVSMMPEQLEKQLIPQEIADLFAYLALDKPPSDPTGKYLPGAPRHGQ